MSGAVRKVIDERLYLSKAKGGGMLRREVSVDREGLVVRYSLAYINHLVHAGDNGRVLGYDSAHERHHRHYKGRTTMVPFESFRQTEARFQKEWTILVKGARRA